jgi:hypothetical protein
MVGRNGRRISEPVDPRPSKAGSRTAERVQEAGEDGSSVLPENASFHVLFHARSEVTQLGSRAIAAQRAWHHAFINAGLASIITPLQLPTAGLWVTL